ncbi:MAG: TetR/AcrR family transcriptional regulator C-terminal domain-containing protein [Miltoncostaeaceae bacterium]
MPPTGTTSRPPLTRRRILEAALTLIDGRGLDELTMRGLGAELGVEAMSIYKHVPGKGAVLDGVVELLLEELEADGPVLPDWRECLTDFAGRVRRLSLAHPLSFPLLARRSASAWLVGRTLVEEGMRSMIAGGFSREDAVAGMRLVMRFTLGFSFTAPGVGATDDGPALVAGQELAGEFPLTADVLSAMRAGDGEQRLFEMGLAALVRGLEPSAAPR